MNHEYSEYGLNIFYARWNFLGLNFLDLFLTLVTSIGIPQNQGILALLKLTFLKLLIKQSWVRMRHACSFVFFLILQENQDIVQIHYNELIHVLLNNIHDVLENGRSIEEIEGHCHVHKCPLHLWNVVFHLS